MPGTVRGSIPNGASAFAPHPPSASWISAIAQNCGQKRHHPSAGSWWWQICPSFMAGTRVLKISYRYGSIEKKYWGMWVDCWYSIFLCCILNKTFQTNTILFHLMNKKFFEAWKEFYYSVFSGNHKFAINRGKARQNQSYGRSPFPLSENPEAVWRIRLFLEDQLLCLNRPV